MKSLRTAWLLALIGLIGWNAAAAPALDRAKFAAIEHAVTNAIGEQRLPGAVVWLERNGEVDEQAFGQRALVPQVEPMTTNTVFDVASLTKVLATAPSMMKLIERGQVKLNEKVSTYLPEFTGGGAENITIRHLMTHTSGLRAGISNLPFEDYRSGIAQAVKEKPNAAPGTLFRYSDINFILLGEVVQRVSGKRLDEFAAAEIWRPLGMNVTRYLPPASWKERIAPTENGLRGVVHDPTSRRMGGVAGHAGVFSTAADIARYARMMLRGGELDGVRVFKPETVQLMTSVQSPEGVTARRGLGWDIDCAYSRPRGMVFPLGSFGHTGWTGTALWIDPFSKTFFIFLSNRVHPDGKGNVVPLYAAMGTLAAQAVADFDFKNVPGALPFRTNFIEWGAVTNLVAPSAQARPLPEVPGVLNGIDVLVKQNFAPLKKRKIGLITNHTGIDRHRRPTIDLLHSAPDVELVALFSPEHGIRGELDTTITNSVDARTGLPVFSLYPKIPKKKDEQSQADYDAMALQMRAPSAEQLRGLDALVFDIQDIGCRFYTYIATLGTCMEAAAKAEVKFIVLDRVNPINGVTIEGPIHRGHSTFVAYHSIPLRHGMTVGELARMYAAERGVKVDLTVIPIEGWKRAMWFDETGLPWLNPSPNMRSLRAAILYPGVGLHESAVSVGRGTETPFEVVGAPYVNDIEAAYALNHAGLDGVRFVPVRFTPTFSTFSNKVCRGVSLVLTDRNRFRAVDTGVAIGLTLRQLGGTNYALAKTTHLLQSATVRDGIDSGRPLAELRKEWAADVGEFEQRRKPFLLYD